MVTAVAHTLSLFHSIELCLQLHPDEILWSCKQGTTHETRRGSPNAASAPSCAWFLLAIFVMLLNPILLFHF